MSPTYNQLVREGYDLNKFSKGATVLTVSAVAFTLISISVPETLPYLLLYWAFALVAVYAGKRKSEVLFRHESLKIKNIWKPIILAVFLGVTVYTIVVLMTGWKVRGSAEELIPQIIAWCLMVGVIEEFGFRWVLPTVLPYPIFTSNALFALAHPIVRGGSASFDTRLWFWLLYFLFGVFLSVLVMMYERSRWFNGSRYFGILSAITWHGVHNAFAIIFGPAGAGDVLNPI